MFFRLFPSLLRSVKGRPRAAVRLILGALLIAVFLGIRAMEKPWEGAHARRIALGRALRFDDILHIQLWWAFAIVGAALALLLLTSRWWMNATRTGDPAPVPALEAPAASPPSGRRKWTLPLILLLALAVRAPRMDRAVERDEQDTVRLGMVGYLKPGPDGGETPVVHPWKTTLWEDRLGNNPFLYSITGRLSLAVWRKSAGAEPWRIHRVVLRLPALAAGLGSIAALWWLLRLCGLPRAALWTALLAAIQPLHIDHSTNARGYGMVMLFQTLALCCVWLALHRGQWRHWIALAACLLGMLYSNPGSIYSGAWLGAGLAGMLGWRAFRRGDAAARVSLWRFLIACLLAALVFLPLILPPLPQAMKFYDRFRGALGTNWLLFTWTHYTAGIGAPAIAEGQEWLKTGLSSPVFILTRFFPNQPGLATLSLVWFPALLAAGAVSWWRGGPARRLILLVGVAAPASAYLYHLPARTLYLYYWYMIYWLPVCLLLAGTGAAALGARLARRFTKPWLAALPGAVLLTWMGAEISAGHPGTLRLFPGPQKDTVIFGRGNFDWSTDPAGVTRLLPPGGPGSPARHGSSLR